MPHKLAYKIGCLVALVCLVAEGILLFGEPAEARGRILRYPGPQANHPHNWNYSHVGRRSRRIYCRNLQRLTTRRDSTSGEFYYGEAPVRVQSAASFQRQSSFQSRRGDRRGAQINRQRTERVRRVGGGRSQ
jgi:hypothetical protein